MDRVVPVAQYVECWLQGFRFEYIGLEGPWGTISIYAIPVFNNGHKTVAFLRWREMPSQFLIFTLIYSLYIFKDKYKSKISGMLCDIGWVFRPKQTCPYPLAFYCLYRKQWSGARPECKVIDTAIKSITLAKIGRKSIWSIIVELTIHSNLSKDHSWYMGIPLSTLSHEPFETMLNIYNLF